ncbi:MAG: copper chaperone PCu(A)C [Mesorhizobium sp.]|uniref:copper chaperone PCu(A)C n=1 Tax=Mesorhizobium sp. TaxID=1871066 RepID=UPI000FE6F771|nr:copper chaperone PCu(A)C [Mesorhizobium sp.]RWA75434.1 MAG: copper chaperone PCu(A)C [Mesorhizobium sp.]
MKYVIAAIVVVGAWASVAAEASGSIVVERAWARASPMDAPNGAAYLTIVNNGTEGDRLINASSTVAENIQFHEERTEDGIAKMRQLEVIEVPPGSTVRLKPSGVHLLMHLKRQLKAGEAFLLILNFEKAGAVQVTANIGKAGAMDDTSGK